MFCCPLGPFLPLYGSRPSPYILRKVGYKSVWCLGLWSSCTGFRRVLPRHGWTSASLSIEELEELLAPPDTVVIAWHLTVRDCLLRSNLPRANLLEASLAAKEPQPKGLMSGP